MSVNIRIWIDRRPIHHDYYRKPLEILHCAFGAVYWPAAHRIYYKAMALGIDIVMGV